MPGKARADAPNYRESDSDTQRCGTCTHFMDGRCDLYNFAADPSYVCDSWAARGMAGKQTPGEREYKSIPQFVKQIEDRTVTGIAVVHGNVDEGGDRSHPGLFGDGTVNGRRRTVFLWQHNSMEPPIAAIDRIYEVDKADLPPAVKNYAPEATGGVAVQRTYLSDDITTRPGLVLAGLKAGAITEMSYAFEPTRWDIEERDDARTVRNLYRANPFDFSDVNWGMNPATSATGLKGTPLEIEQQTVLAAVTRYITRLEALAQLRAKEGRVLSGENRKRIESTIEALDSAIGALKALLAASEPQKRGGYSDTNALRAAWSRQQQRLRELGVST